MSWCKWGSVAGVFGTPVKSTALNRLDEGELRFDGLANNRTWAVWDPIKKCVVTAKRKDGSKLLLVRATHCADGDFISIDAVNWHKCGTLAANKLLTEYLGRPVRMIRVRDLVQGLQTNFGFSLRPGLGVDSTTLHAIATQAIRVLGINVSEGVARFRPTFTYNRGAHAPGSSVDPGSYRILRIGSSVLAVRKRTERCPETRWTRLGLDGEVLPERPRILQTVRQAAPADDGSGVFLGTYLTVVEPGVIRVGDAVTILAP